MTCPFNAHNQHEFDVIARYYSYIATGLRRVLAWNLQCSAYRTPGDGLKHDPGLWRVALKPYFPTHLTQITLGLVQGRRVSWHRFLAGLIWEHPEKDLRFSLLIAG